MQTKNTCCNGCTSFLPMQSIPTQADSHKHIQKIKVMVERHELAIARKVLVQEITRNILGYLSQSKLELCNHTSVE